jgi:hypothetical protein
MHKDFRVIREAHERGREGPAQHPVVVAGSAEIAVVPNVKLVYFNAKAAESLVVAASANWS